MLIAHLQLLVLLHQELQNLKSVPGGGIVYRQSSPSCPTPSTIGLNSFPVLEFSKITVLSDSGGCLKMNGFQLWGDTVDRNPSKQSFVCVEQ